MALRDNLEDVKIQLEQMKKNHRFKKANALTQKNAEMTAALLKCSGKLEICKKDFERTIRNQSRSISEGMSQGTDTMVQEQMLWDAAIGYMLVRDAMFALRSVSTYDSIAHAYEFLDAATKQITGARRALPKIPRIGANKKRNEYGYITSAEALREKEDLLDTFFETLKTTGDIEGCLAGARHPSTRQAEIRHAVSTGVLTAELSGAESTGGSDIDERMRRLGAVGGMEDDSELYDVDLDSMGDYRPPKNV